MKKQQRVLKSENKSLYFKETCAIKVHPFFSSAFWDCVSDTSNILNFHILYSKYSNCFLSHFQTLIIFLIYFTSLISSFVKIAFLLFWVYFDGFCSSHDTLLQREFILHIRHIPYFKTHHLILHPSLHAPLLPYLPLSDWLSRPDRPS